MSKTLFIVTVTLTFDLLIPTLIGFFPFHRKIMWPSLVKIRYTELKFFISIKTIPPLDSLNMRLFQLQEPVFIIQDYNKDPDRPVFSTRPPFCANHKPDLCLCLLKCNGSKCATCKLGHAYPSGEYCLILFSVFCSCQMPLARQHLLTPVQHLMLPLCCGYYVWQS